MKSKPKMILFDYGHTLMCEMGFSFLQGQEAVFKHIKSNKNNLTPEQVNNFADEMYSQFQAVRNSGYELHERQFQRILYEYLEIELSITYEEAECIQWECSADAVVMPNVVEMLDFLSTNGIRSGVISNIGWSGKALEERLNYFLPQNKFEYIIASSEYIFRKPNRILFELALKKADLAAGDVWFCGDNVIADVEGSAAIGMYPVWYDDRTIENQWRGNDKEKPDCEHLHINDWLEMIDVLERL